MRAQQSESDARGERRLCTSRLRDEDTAGSEHRVAIVRERVYLDAQRQKCERLWREHHQMACHTSEAGNSSWSTEAQPLLGSPIGMGMGIGIGIGIAMRMGQGWGWRMKDGDGDGDGDWDGDVFWNRIGMGMGMGMGIW